MATVVKELANFINGDFIKYPKYLDSYNPATGEVFLKVPDSGSEEIEQAVQAASKAFKSWSNRPPSERASYLNKIADAIEARLDEFAMAESLDQGKPVWFAKAVEIPRVSMNFRFFASGCQHVIDTSTVLPQMGVINYTCRRPVGVAGQITPWNLPLYLLTFKIAPALAVGCTVVCKPSEMTSLTAFMLAEVMKEIGLPPGVCNIVFGTGPRAAQALVTHPNVPVISFTGSTTVGERIQELSAPYCKKLSLELGGKNAGIIFADADLDKCLPVIKRSSFANQGEICLTTSRIFVQEAIFDEFLEKYVELTKNIKVGDPKDPNNFVGAINSKQHYDKIQSFIKLAKQEDCTIHTGFEQLDLPDENKKGYFMRPTIITNVSDNSKLMQEEIFGPVTCVVPFRTEEEVIKRANDVKYGLCASVWTENSGASHRVAQALDVGTVWVNCWAVRDLNVPFGGCKYSGIGREGFKDSMEFYTEVKTVCIKQSF